MYCILTILTKVHYKPTWWCICSRVTRSKLFIWGTEVLHLWDKVGKRDEMALANYKFIIHIQNIIQDFNSNIAKIADLQAQNASQCDMFCACRSAIFDTTVQSTSCNVAPLEWVWKYSGRFEHWCLPVIMWDRQGLNIFNDLLSDLPAAMCDCF